MTKKLTLLTIDTDPLSQALTRFAITKTLGCVDIDEIICFGIQSYGLGERFIKINRFGSMDEYSEFVLKCLWPFLQQDGHTLIVHWDGFAVNRALWSDEFIKVDYIGAPWQAWIAEDHCVGNGGFSLRSNQLIRACSDVRVRRHPGEVLFGDAEDIVICRIYRNYFESKGFKFATRELAQRFSFETGELTQPTFGFHAPHNMPLYLTENELFDLTEPLLAKIGTGATMQKFLTVAAKMQHFDFVRMMLQKHPELLPQLQPST